MATKPRLKTTVLELLNHLVAAHADGDVLTMTSQDGADTFNLSPKFHYSIKFKIVYRETAGGKPYFRVYLVSKKGKSQAVARIDTPYDAARFVTAAESFFSIRAGRHGAPEDEDDD